MTMPNGAAPKIQSGMHAQPGPMSYVVGTKMAPTPAGLQKFVVLHIEHATGTAIFPMAPEVARAIGDAMLKAATGIEIARPGV